MWTYQRLFDLPVYWVAEYVSDQIRHETDFSREGKSAERTAGYLRDEPRLKDRVIVPCVCLPARDSVADKVTSAVRSFGTTLHLAS